MRSGIRLGSVGGVPIIGDASVVVLVLLFGGAVLVDLNRFAVLAPSSMRGFIAFVAGVGLVGCLLVHELSHAGVARRRSMLVREIRLFMFGGYSVITGKPSPVDEVVIAVAGPVASSVLAGAAWFGVAVVGGESATGRALSALMLANVAIALFNLLPGFPLDGARVLRGVLTWRSGDRLKATQTVNTIGRYLGWTTVGIGALLMVAREPAGLFVAIGGWFLTRIATAVGRREELGVAVDGMTVGDVMRRTPEAVSADWTISALLDLFAFETSLRPLPVEVSGHVVGVVGQDEVDTVSPSRWSSTRVRSLMSPIGPGDVVAATDSLESLLLRPASAIGAVVVVADNSVVGIVDGQSLGTVL